MEQTLIAKKQIRCATRTLLVPLLLANPETVIDDCESVVRKLEVIHEPTGEHLLPSSLEIPLGTMFPLIAQLRFALSV